MKYWEARDAANRAAVLSLNFFKASSMLVLGFLSSIIHMKVLVLERESARLSKNVIFLVMPHVPRRMSDPQLRHFHELFLAACLAHVVTCRLPHYCYCTAKLQLQ